MSEWQRVTNIITRGGQDANASCLLQKTFVFLSSSNVATSCDACHSLARCHSGLRDNGVESISCLCGDGLVGDGFTCYNKTTCNDDCCVRGYSWSPLQGCVDIDECSLPSPPCGPDQLCENTPGSYACQATPDLQHDSADKTTSRSVVFHCGDVQCPAGQDCLEVNGTSRCADPCRYYTPLHDDWRATTYDSDGGRCDNYLSWTGWYRLFINNTSVQMPERCIEKFRCGTSVPLWLKTPHPQFHEGIIQADVHGHWYESCSNVRPNPIHVKACPRNYYVYKFVKPGRCTLTYCAGKQLLFVSSVCLKYQLLRTP